MAYKRAFHIAGIFAAFRLFGKADSDGWNDLGKRSPFGQAPPAATQGATASQLELRGMLVEGKERWFNIYDTTSKKAEWVNDSEASGTYIVKQYDPVHDALTLETHGRMVSVLLKSAGDPLTGLGAGQMLASNKSGALSRPPTVAPSPPNSEIKRYALVADIIRQRREQRSHSAVSSTGSKT